MLDIGYWMSYRRKGLMDTEVYQHPSYIYLRYIHRLSINKTLLSPHPPYHITYIIGNQQ